MERARRKLAATAVPAKSTQAVPFRRPRINRNDTLATRIQREEANIRVNIAPTVDSVGRFSKFKRTAQELAKLRHVQPTGIDVRTLSGSDIRKGQQITKADTKHDNPLGLMSKSMGSTLNTEICTNCRQILCPGHPGYLELAVPMIVPIHLPRVIMVANSICRGCAGLLLPDDQAPPARLKGDLRLAYYAAASTDLACTRNTTDVNGNVVDCRGTTIPKIDKKLYPNKNEGANYLPYMQGETEHRIDSTKVYDWFNQVSADTCVKLGFRKDFHVRDFIWKQLPIIPVTARPSTISRTDEKIHPLTKIYSDIVKTNESLANVLDGKATAKKTRGESKVPVAASLEHELWIQIFQSIVGEENSRKNKNEVKRGVYNSVNGKDAYIRGNNQGKRCDFTARGVISPGTGLRYGWLGVPSRITAYMRIPEIVSKDNLDLLLQLHKYGLLISYTPVGETIQVPIVAADPKLSLSIGDEVERRAINGDWIIFNRQPTITKESILAYQIQVTDDPTIRLHPSATQQHAADFDGDAAALKIARSKESILECIKLMTATRHIIDDKHNKTAANLILDSISSAYLLTRDIILEPVRFRNLINSMDTIVDIDELQERAAYYNLPAWSGPTLFSALFPKNFRYSKAGVKICEGIIVEGRVTNKHTGLQDRTFVQDVWTHFGHEQAAQFITDATWLLVAYVSSYGLSIGPADCEYGMQTEDFDAQAIQTEIDRKVKELGKIPTDPREQDRYEEKIVNFIDNSNIYSERLAYAAMDESKQVMGRQNAIGIMAKDIGAGAKSDIFNIKQIGGSVGAQYYVGTRPVRTMNDGERVTAYHPRRPKDEEPPISERGYVAGNYAAGIKILEMIDTFFGARSGMIDTNVNTSRVGHTQRSLGKALSDHTLQKDNSIRNVRGDIYDFVFGGDGLESRHMFLVKTRAFGDIPSFIDLQQEADMINIEHGWIPNEIVKAIERNKKRVWDDLNVTRIAPKQAKGRQYGLASLVEV